MQRRKHTRHLTEPGRLARKTGLIEIANDDRATIYVAPLDFTGRVRGDDAGGMLALWKRRGKVQAIATPHSLDPDAAR